MPFIWASERYAIEHPAIKDALAYDEDDIKNYE
jgi:hypothetical protein